MWSNDRERKVDRVVEGVILLVREQPLPETKEDNPLFNVSYQSGGDTVSDLIAKKMRIL
jgi:hypothetical protein